MHQHLYLGSSSVFTPGTSSHLRRAFLSDFMSHHPPFNPLEFILSILPVEADSANGMARERMRSNSKKPFHQVSEYKKKKGMSTKRDHKYRYFLTILKNLGTITEVGFYVDIIWF
jgi:hypothetical protein